MVEKLTTSVSEYERKARGTLPSDLFSRWFGSRDDPLWSTNHSNEDGFNRVYLRPRVLDADPRRQSPRQGRWRRHLVPGDSRAGGCTNAIPSRRRGRYRPRGPACGHGFRSQRRRQLQHRGGQGELGWPPLVPALRIQGPKADQSLIQRAEEAGYTALIVTVDEPATRTSERDGATSLRLNRQPNGMTSNTTPFGNLRGTGIDNAEFIIEAMEPRLTWDVIDWIAANTRLPVVIKGIPTAEDAACCLQHDVAGMVVSNHGGHTLQGAYPTILTLPEVVDAVGDRLDIYLDRGIRRGTDVLKAVAAGVRAVVIGRAMYWGLAVGGEAGVLEVLNVLREELYLALPFLQHLRHEQGRSKSAPIPGLACRGAAIRMRPSLGCHFGRLVSTPEIGRHLLKLSSGMQ
jgi:4-hydroxymandelate oxidase